MKFKSWTLLTALPVIIVLVFTWNRGYITRDTFNWKMAHNTSKALSDNEFTTSLSMDLYLRLTTAKPALSRYYESLLVQSMRYFWPDNFSMVVVFDNASRIILSQTSYGKHFLFQELVSWIR